MLTPAIPPDESMANHLRCCLDVKASTEIVVVLQSHEAFPPWGLKVNAIQVIPCLVKCYSGYVIRPLTPLSHMAPRLGEIKQNKSIIHPSTSMWFPLFYFPQALEPNLNFKISKMGRVKMIVCYCFAYLNIALSSRSHVFHSPMFYFCGVVAFSRPHFELIRVFPHAHEKHVSELVTFR